MAKRLEELESIPQNHQPSLSHTADNLSRPIRSPESGSQSAPQRTSCLLTSFDYLESVVSHLAVDQGKLASSIPITSPSVVTKTGYEIFRDTSLRSAPGTFQLPFGPETARHLFIIYQTNIETFLPILGLNAFDDNVEVLLHTQSSASESSTFSASRLCSMLSLATSLLMMASSSTINLCSVGPDQLMASKFLQWGQNLYEDSLANVGDIVGELLLGSSRETGGEPCILATRIQQRVLTAVRIVLQLTLCSLFMPQRASARQLLGFADELLMGDFLPIAGLRGAPNVGSRMSSGEAGSQFKYDVDQVNRTFLTLERLIAMADGYVCGIHELPQKESREWSEAHAHATTTGGSSPTISALYHDVIAVKWSCYLQCLQQLRSRENIAISEAATLEKITQTAFHLQAWRRSWDTTCRDHVFQQSHNGLTGLPTNSDASSSHLQWLLEYGDVLQHEATHYVCRSQICLHERHSDNQNLQPELGLDRSHFTALIARAVENMGITVSSLAKLLFQSRSLSPPPASPHPTNPSSSNNIVPIPLIYPSTWPWMLQVFELALTAIVASHASPDTYMPLAKRAQGAQKSAAPRTNDAMADDHIQQQPYGLDRDDQHNSMPSQLDLCVRLLLGCGQSNTPGATALTQALVALIAAIQR